MLDELLKLHPEHAWEVAKARAFILKSPNPSAAAYRIQNKLLELIEAAVLVWADRKRPDPRVVLAELPRIRAFRQMLKTIKPKKKKRNARRSVARRRRRS